MLHMDWKLKSSIKWKLKRKWENIIYFPTNEKEQRSKIQLNEQKIKHIHLHLQGANLWYTRELVGEEPNVDNQRY